MQKTVKQNNPEILELIKLAQNGNSRAENRLIKKHEYYVSYMIRKYSKKTWIKDDADLRSYIYMGLLEGIRQFDASRGTFFVYFAHIHIKKYIFSNENIFRFIRLPANQKNFYDKNRRVYDDLTIDTFENSNLTDSDISQMDIIERSNTNSFSTQTLYNDTDDMEYTSVDDLLNNYSKSIVSDQDKIETQEVLKKNINNILDKLDAKEHFIIEPLYGLNDKSMMIPEQIATSLSVTKVNITFIRNKLIRLMRHSLLSNMLLKEVF